ncbi:glyoxalase family protein [Trichomonas vaginalis G3]|uniref:Glyoxalase family protein n=1 Tax=Trichomonas vaginalis (strain ATCC PRA-98 / G3) TaxID=412133 RepID=A2EFS9_TRIV3|nr:glyoxalase [Trichomonas vaginalis G3]EAY08480.1 glyoxalase family protein [Trichomonas vaginalis G3]KAI5537763.1 lyase-related-related family [Trichomonas vaginalis G3]|eukprot:XP_001320703.1 glyoxalase [Trichomonas vaginalis G3]
MEVKSIRLNVSDLEKEVAFFTNFLDVKEKSIIDGKATLRFENRIELILVYVENKGKDERPNQMFYKGIHHIAFSVGSESKVDEITAKVKASGYTVISGPRRTDDGYYESAFYDDEKNQIEITV